MRYWEIINEALNMELTIQNWAKPLRDRVKRDTKFSIPTEMTDQELIDWFAQWDPTKAKKYLINWILPRYVWGGINYAEDLEGVMDDLAKFDRFKQRMPEKDILKIKTAAELATMVRETLRPVGSLSGPNGMIPPSEVQAAHSESIKVFEDDTNLIIIPLTARAAGFWGRHSNWCTAYGYKWGNYPDRTSWFERYSGEGQRLLIVLDKQNPEADDLNYQCHYDGEFGEESQIMDLSDYDAIDENKLAKIFEKLNNSQLEVIVNNCLKTYDIETSSTSQFDIHSTNKINMDSKLIAKNIKFSDLIKHHSNSTALNAWSIIIGDRHWDPPYFEENLETIVEDRLPRKLRDKLAAWLDKKYPGSEDESIADCLENNDEYQIIETLRSENFNAYRSGSEGDMWQAFDEAVSEANVRLLEPHNYEGLCSVIGPKVIDFLSYPRFREGPDDNQLIMLHEPNYGWDGYDESIWEQGEIEALLT